MEEEKEGEFIVVEGKLVDTVDNGGAVMSDDEGWGLGSLGGQASATRSYVIVDSGTRSATQGTEIPGATSSSSRSTFQFAPSGTCQCPY